MTAAKAFEECIRLYPLLKSEHLSTNTKLTPYKALIRSIMTYVCPAWKFAADSHLLKFQHLQNKVLCTNGNLPWCILTHDLHVKFKFLYIYDSDTKLCRQQAEVTQNYENVNIRNTGKSKVQNRKYERLKLGGSQACDHSSV
jgi:hypothetical protein